MGQKNWGGLLCPFGWVELGPHLIQCHLGQGLPPYQVASWSVKPFGHNTRVLQTTGDRQTTSHDNSRTLHCNGRLIMRFVIFIIHQGLENIETFFVKTKTKTFSSRPRPKPYFVSSRHLETKTKVSRLHPCLQHKHNCVVPNTGLSNAPTKTRICTSLKSDFYFRFHSPLNTKPALLNFICTWDLVLICWKMWWPEPENCRNPNSHTPKIGNYYFRFVSQRTGVDAITFMSRMQNLLKICKELWT